MFAGIKLLSYLYCYFIHKQLILGKFSKKNPVVLAWIFVKSSILYVRLGSEYASCIITNIVDLEHDFAWRATTVTPTSSYLCWGRLIIVSFPRRFIVTPFTRAIVYWKFWKSYGKKVKNKVIIIENIQYFCDKYYANSFLFLENQFLYTPMP